MASDPVTAVANALAQVTGAVRPFLDEHMARKLDNEHQNRITEFQKILAESNPDRRALQLQSYVLRLLTQAGTVAGPVSTESIEVPLQHFIALIAEVSDSVRHEAKLARLEFKAR